MCCGLWRVHHQERQKNPYFVNTGNYKTGEQISKLGDFYATTIHETCGGNFDAMFGPAYKGIPLATAAAGALYRNYGVDKPHFFNRKEIKDHGEGGGLIGYKPKDGDNIIIVEDVITAGTAVRETMPLLKSLRRCPRSAICLSRSTAARSARTPPKPRCSR